MAGLAYTYIPLEGSTLIQRKHPRDIEPPGMVSIDNMFLSRSDKSIALRPDLDVSSDSIYSIQPLMQCGTQNDDDYLNSCVGLYGTDGLLFFGKTFPMGSNGQSIKCDIIDSGSVTATSATSTRTETLINISSSSVINCETDMWAGCWIVFDFNSNYYRVNSIIDSTSFYLDEPSVSVSASEFTLYRPHNNLNANYKINPQVFGTSIVYSSPSFTSNYSESNIAGPFYTNTIPGYSGFYAIQEDAGAEWTQTVQGGYGRLASTSNNPTTTVRYMYAPPNYSTADNYYFYTATQAEIVAGTDWTAVEDDQFTADIEGRFISGLYFDGTYFWLHGSEYESTGPVTSPFLHRITNSATPTITTKNPVVAGFARVDQFCVASGGNLVASYSSKLIYSSDGGANWSDVSIAGFTTTYLFSSVLDSTVYAVGYTFSSPTYTYLIKKSSDGGATWSDYDTNISSGTNQVIVSGHFEDATNWGLIINYLNSTYYYFKGDSTITAAENGSQGGFDGVPSTISRLMYDGSQYDTYLIGYSRSSDPGYVLSVDTTNKTVEKAYVLNSVDDWCVQVDLCLPLVDTVWDERKYLAVGYKASGSDLELQQIILEAGYTVEAQTDVFSPLSDSYRSNVYSILGGYLVLFGTLEYDSDTETWEYEKRRIRWTAPSAISDFSGVGSGTADCGGNDYFIDARSVNGRIVTFESSSIGALVPRGIVADPWDYERIYEGIKILSNPIVVEDQCYFIASDGLLYVTNGISVKETGSSFDATKFDDFNETSPIWLVYSSEFKSLIAFYPDGTNNEAYFIALSTGSVSKFGLPTSSNAGSNDPSSIVSIENSSDQRVFVSYNPNTGNTDGIVITEFSTGSPIYGIDSLYTSGDDHYWYGTLETGNIFLIEEGVKVALKHIIIYTYTDASVGTTDMPDIIVEVKSIEDSSYNGARSVELDEAVNVTTTACTISTSTPPAALSNVLGTANGAAVTYNLPWIATNCRVYTYTGGTYTSCTLVTSTPDAANEYQITGTKQIKVYGTNGHTVYCFCENEPFVKVEAGDYIESDEGLHRIKSLTNYTTAVLDRYKASGTDATADHLSAEQMAVGHGQVKLGINRLVEGVQIKIRIVPRHATGETHQPTVAKITGISLGYIPLGEKIVEATGG